MKEVYIIDGIRTPIGSYKGTLSPVRTDDLAALARELEESGIASAACESVDELLERAVAGAEPGDVLDRKSVV